MAQARVMQVFGAINPGSSRVSALILGRTETGELVVLGSGMRRSEGIRRGYITDMEAATHAVRSALELAESDAGARVASVWVGCSGAGLASRTSRIEMPIGGRRIEDEDIEDLLASAQSSIEPDGKLLLHAQPAQYALDGAHGVENPIGLHAEQLGVDIHVMLADGPPVRNLREAVQNAHLTVEAVVATPIANGLACLSAEERELGTALVEIGSDLTSVAVFRDGMLQALGQIGHGSGDITDAVAGAFGIRRFHAERLKCVSGSAIASPTDTREMVPVYPPGDTSGNEQTVNRAELVAVITEQLARLSTEIGRTLKALDFGGARGQVVLTGGGAQLAGCADYLQGALGHPVRIGKPPELRGMPDAMASPAFTSLVGLCLFAANRPVDLHHDGRSPRGGQGTRGLGLARRVWHAAREYF